MGLTLSYDLELTHLVRTYQPEAMLVGGGMVATVRPDLLKEGALDFIIKGYGEEPLLDLLSKINQGKNPKGIPGLYSRDSNTGEFIVGKPARVPTGDDLRVYSFLLDPTIGMDIEYQSPDGLYRNISDERLKTFRLNAQGYCSGECIFCATKNFLKIATGEEKIPYLSLSAQERVSLVANIAEKLPQIETIFISDDDFFADKHLAEDFFSKIIEGKQKGQLRDIKFIMSARIDEVDKVDLDLAKKAGVILINFGVESFSPPILKRLNKKLKIPQEKKEILERVKRVIKAGIIPSINLMIFVPWTTWEDIKLTTEGALEIMEMGGEVNLTTYIRNYYGADITQENYLKEMPFSSFTEVLNFGEEKNIFNHPTLFLPKDELIRKFAKRVIIERAKLEEGYKRKYAWSHRRAPSIVVQLVFLEALLEEGKSFFKDEDTKNETLLRKIREMIDGQFKKLNSNLREEEDLRYPTLSLSEKHQKEAKELIDKLRLSQLEEDLVGLFFGLKTGLFCLLFEDDCFDVVSSFLKYLFFAKERSRFFHLDNLEKFILILALAVKFEKRLNLDFDKLTFISSAFGLRIDKDFYQEAMEKIKILSEINLWEGDDLAEEINEDIKQMLRNILIFAKNSFSFQKKEEEKQSVLLAA